MQPLPEIDATGLDRLRFEAEVVAPAEPLVLRGLVARWPLVERASAAADPGLALLRELVAADGGADVDAVMLPPGRGRRLFYDADGSGFNYLRRRLPLAAVCEQLLRYSRFADPPRVAVQSAPVATCAPALLQAHTLAPLLDAAVAPRLWLGNAISTPTHFDESHNVACVVAGRRRFTLFPTDQVGNLSVGPLGHAPTGTPISLPDPEAPDLAAYPRFADALAAARSAELEPGDAIYIPPLVWHHVASLAPLNLLLNFWWSPGDPPSGLDALQAAIVSFASLPPAQRRRWQALFAHWVFEADERTHAHIPPTMRPPPRR
jgi:hypothetical protein